MFTSSRDNARRPSKLRRPAGILVGIYAHLIHLLVARRNDWFNEDNQRKIRDGKCARDYQVSEISEARFAKLRGWREKKRKVGECDMQQTPIPKLSESSKF